MEEFKELFLLLKEYLQKQKENISLGAAESMTKLFFAATMGIVMIVLGGITMLLVCFALAFYINEVTGSAVIGFGSLAGAIFLISVVFWFKRKQWVLQPIARLMVRIFLDATESRENNTSTAQQ